MKWLPIESAPQNQKKMFLVVGIAVEGLRTSPYMTDPVATWSENGKFPRWKWGFEPTHWCPIPDFTEEEDLVAKLEDILPRITTDGDGKWHSVAWPDHTMMVETDLKQQIARVESFNAYDAALVALAPTMARFILDKFSKKGA